MGFVKKQGNFRSIFEQKAPCFFILRYFSLILRLNRLQRIFGKLTKFVHNNGKVKGNALQYKKK